MKHKTQKLKLQKNYTPKVQNSEEIEIYPNGIFKFFISKIIEDIEDGIFQPPDFIAGSPKFRLNNI